MKLLTLVIIGIFITFVHQTHATCFKLGTKSAEPFSIIASGVDTGIYPKIFDITDWTGYSADLWGAIWKQLQNDYSCVELSLYQSNDAGFDGVVANNISAFMAASTITADRLDRVDFIVHYRGNQLKVLVKADVNSVDTVLNVFRAIFSAQFWLLMFVFTLFIVAMGYIVFLSDRIRRNKSQSLFRDDIKRGLPKAMMWTTLASFKKEVREPKTLCTGFFLIFLTVFSIMLTALAVGAMVQLQENSKESLEINSFSDLGGKKIGTVINSQPYQYMIDNLHSVKIVPYNSINEMFDGFTNGETEGSIYDLPILIYRQSSNKNFKNTRIVGKGVDETDMGIAIGNDHNVIQEQFTKIMSNLRRTGAVDVLRRHWFTGSEVDLANDDALRSTLILTGVVAGIVFVLGVFTHFYIRYKEVQRVHKLEKKKREQNNENAPTSEENLQNDFIASLSFSKAYAERRKIIEEDDKKETELEALRYDNPEDVMFKNRKDIIISRNTLNQIFTVVTNIGQHLQTIHKQTIDTENHQQAFVPDNLNDAKRRNRYPDKDTLIEMAPIQQAQSVPLVLPLPLTTNNAASNVENQLNNLTNNNSTSGGYPTKNNANI